MPTTLDQIEARTREALIEPTPKFWSSDELKNITRNGIRDLWRSIVDLKGEHYLTINDTDVTIEAGDDELSGVPADVHKIYNIELRDPSSLTTHSTVTFTPLDYNHKRFASARTRQAISPVGGEIFYAITGQGAPVSAPIIKIAPTTTSTVNLTFSYCPTIDFATIESIVPIPGEADNALIAWTVAYARAKESENRAPDAGWLSIYSTEKQSLLQSLGVRQYQEPTITDGMFEELW